MNLLTKKSPTDRENLSGFLICLLRSNLRHMSKLLFDFFDKDGVLFDLGLSLSAFSKGGRACVPHFSVSG